MGLKLGVVGAGEYATAFLPLFQKHPAVEEVFPERRRETAAAFKLKRSVASLDELLATDVDAVAICTQRWMHGPQAIKALKAGCERLACRGVHARVEGDRIIKDPAAPTVMNGMSDMHDIGRLSAVYFESPGNYHEGSHPFLVTDFVEACVREKMPTNNVWVAARYALPGIIAHRSAQKDGETMRIPDFGDPPRA